MEQWCATARERIRERMHSLIPAWAADEGFTEDLTEGLRGILKKQTSPPADPQSPLPDPKNHAECVVRYAYRQPQSGEVLDDNHNKPLTINVGVGAVPEGFDEALLSLRVGERAVFYLDPAFGLQASGLRGATGQVPSSEPVLLELELISLNNVLSYRRKLREAEELKDAGNGLLRDQKDPIGAAKKYHDAIFRLQAFAEPDAGEKPEDLLAEDQHLRAVLYTNIAVCWFERGEFNTCIEYCQRALKKEGDYAKAKLRKVLAWEKKFEFDSAITLLTEIIHDTKQQDNLNISFLKGIRTRLEESKKLQTGKSNKLFAHMLPA